MALLEVRDLVMRFGGVRALDGVNLEIGENEIVGIIGPNGAGKTTLFNVLTGALKPTAGVVRFRERDIAGEAADAIARLGMSRTYQKVRPFPRLTALENVMVPILNRAVAVGSMREAEAIATDLLNRVGLGEYAQVEASRLSLFHRKKIELARAIGADAKLVLLDEVMAGLTPVEADAAVELLRRMRAEFGFSLVCVEHLMRVIMTLSERIVVLERGRVISVGTPSEVAADEHVQRAYLGSNSHA